MKILPYILTFLVLTSFAAAIADPFTIELEAQDWKINSSERAIYIMHLTNNLPVDDLYRMSFSDDINWHIMSKPVSHKLSGIPVKANRTVVSELYLTPTRDLPSGTYRLGVTITSEEIGTTKESVLEVAYQAVPVAPKEYVVNVKSGVRIPREIDPRDTALVNVILSNNNLRNYSDITIALTSVYMNDEGTTLLGPLEEKTVTFPFVFDPLLAPHKDTLHIVVRTPERILEEFDEVYEIVGYADLVAGEEKVKKGFLKSTTSSEYVNEGNIEEKYIVREETTFLKHLFTRTEPPADLVQAQDKSYSYVWRLTLEPQETITLTITNDYRLLFFIILLIVVVVFLYILLQSPVEVKKTTVVLKSKEGGISLFRVNLHIKNRSALAIHHIRVLDRVPQIAHILRKHEVGSLAPSKIVEHEKKGSLIKWELDKLEGYEERIMSYTIKSKLSVLGEVTLPSTIVKFNLDGKEEKIFSNRVRVGSQ